MSKTRPIRPGGGLPTLAARKELEDIGMVHESP
jgi:hypothetical protein